MDMGDIERAYNLYEQQIKFYESRQTRFGAATFSYCAKVALKMGDTQSAIAYYEKAREFKCAAAVALKSGKQDEADILFERQMLVYEKNRNLEAAACLADERNEKDRAKNLRKLSDILR